MEEDIVMPEVEVIEPIESTPEVAVSDAIAEVSKEPVVEPVGVSEIAEIEGYIHALPERLHDAFRKIIAEVKQKL